MRNHRTSLCDAIVIDRLGDDARRDAANAGLRKKVAARGADEKHAAGIMVARSRTPRKRTFLKLVWWRVHAVRALGSSFFLHLTALAVTGPVLHL